MKDTNSSTTDGAKKLSDKVIQHGMTPFLNSSQQFDYWLDVTDRDIDPEHYE